MTTYSIRGALLECDFLNYLGIGLFGSGSVDPFVGIYSHTSPEYNSGPKLRGSRAEVQCGQA